VLRHRVAIDGLLGEVLACCDRVGLLETSLTVTDGTPWSAPTALSGAIPLWRLRLRIDEVTQRLREARMEGQRPGQDPNAAVAAMVEQAGGVGYARERRLVAQLERLQLAESIATARAAGEACNTDPDEQRQRMRDTIADKQRRLDELVAAQQAKYDHSMRRRAAGERLTKTAYKPEDLQCLRKRREVIEDLKKSSLPGRRLVVSRG
jgi:hypothetical protein